MDCDGSAIIGAVRAAIIEDPALIPEDLSTLDLPDKRPFAYCGRTAVHPQYRAGRVMLLLDHAIKQFLASNMSIGFALCFVVPERVNAVKRLGFQRIGSISYDWGAGDETPLEAFILKK